MMSYVSNIANSILSNTGESRVLSPEIYTAIAEWEKREIPAAIVMISLDEVRMLQDKGLAEELPVDVFQSIVTRNFRTWLAHAGETIHRSA